MNKPRLGLLSFALLTGSVAVWWAFAAVLSELLGTAGTLIAHALALLALLVIAFEILLRVADIRWQGVHDERQQQALLGLYTALRPRAPFPLLRTAALSPDIALEYVKLIRELRPAVVLELGSGVSTLLAALQLRDNGTGKVIALDDDEGWTNKTRRDLREHGVEDWTEVRYAPLRPIEVEGDTIHWYDRTRLEGIERIDLLLVDGPKDVGDRGNRRPGLTATLPLLSEDAVIIVDDGIRTRWRHWVYAWAEEHGFVVREPFLNEKRSLILYRKGSALAEG